MIALTILLGLGIALWRTFPLWKPKNFGVSLEERERDLQELIVTLRMGIPLGRALKEMNPAQTQGEAEYLIWSVRRNLIQGKTLSEALHREKKGNSSLLDSFLAVVISNENQPLALTLQGLERLRSLVHSCSKNHRMERAKTTQSRLQFSFVSLLVPVLFSANCFLFPSLMAGSLQSTWGIFLLFLCFFFYAAGFFFFFRVHGRGFDFLLKAQPVQSYGKLSSLPRVTPLQNEIFDFVFLSGLCLFLDSGQTVRAAFVQTCSLCPRGKISQEVASALASQGDLFASPQTRQSRPFLRMMGMAARNQSMLGEVTGGLWEDARERLQERAEERMGAVSVHLLIPLCLCHLPAALLALLIPVLRILAEL